MIYKPNDRSMEISLRISTVVIDESEILEKGLEKLFEKALTGADISREELDDLCERELADEIELYTEGRIKTNKDGQIEIVYVENEDDPKMKALSRIIFDPASPELVVMTKSGAIKSSLSFEEGKTHVCTYLTPYMPFKVYINSLTVENRLLDRGTLKLDYVLNIDDTAPQHFRVDVEIKETPKDCLRALFES